MSKEEELPIGFAIVAFKKEKDPTKLEQFLTYIYETFRQRPQQVAKHPELRSAGLIATIAKKITSDYTRDAQSYMYSGLLAIQEMVKAYPELADVSLVRRVTREAVKCASNKFSSLARETIGVILDSVPTDKFVGVGVNDE